MEKQLSIFNGVFVEKEQHITATVKIKLIPKHSGKKENREIKFWFNDVLNKKII